MSIDEITKAVAESFPSFGGGRTSHYNPLANALANKPVQFAAGVDIKSVVKFVLEHSGIGKN